LKCIHNPFKLGGLIALHHHNADHIESAGARLPSGVCDEEALGRFDDF